MTDLYCGCCHWGMGTVKALVLRTSGSGVLDVMTKLFGAKHLLCTIRFYRKRLFVMIPIIHTPREQERCSGKGGSHGGRVHSTNLKLLPSMIDDGIEKTLICTKFLVS